MNKSNTYIFIYSSVLVILVATFLALAANVLKPLQEKNLEIAKKLEILHSVDKAWDASSADSKTAYVEAEYDKYITSTFVINQEGDTVSGQDAFLIEPVKEMKKEEASRLFPVFICTQDDGSRNYIFPVNGKGLWGPIWGYVALELDFNTISGAFFDHKGETPGLGSEINTRIFQSQFRNKRLFDESGDYVSVKVSKANEPKTEFHSVDAISGGTITSKGLEATIYESMKHYLPFLKQQNQ